MRTARYVWVIGDEDVALLELFGRVLLAQRAYMPEHRAQMDRLRVGRLYDNPALRVHDARAVIVALLNVG